MPCAAPDVLIEELHQLQLAAGSLTREGLRQLAQRLRLPLSHVYGVASFYHLFHLERPTPHRCTVCLGTACFVRGSLTLAEGLALRIGVRLDDPRGDGVWTLATVGCLGACGQAPVLVVDGTLVTRLPMEPSARRQLEQRLSLAGLPDTQQAPVS